MNVRMLRQNAALDDMSSMDAKKQKPLLRAIIAEYKWAYLTFTIAPDGNNIGRNDEEALRFYGDRGYFKQAIEGRQVGQEVVISRTTGQPAVILSVPVWRLDKVVGVLAVGTSVTEVSTTITNVKIGQTGFAFLVDDQGKVIAHPSARDSLKAHPAVAGLGAEPRKQTSSLKPRASGSSPSPRRRNSAGRSSPSRTTTKPTRHSPWPTATR